MKRYVLIAVCIVAAGSALLAQERTIRRVLPPRQGVTLAEPWTPVNVPGETRIVGMVIDIHMVPVAHARVRLRNLVNGKVEEEKETNENGEYEFLVSDPGTYVVEMVMRSGYIVALSNAGSVGRYETIRTVVQLPGLIQGNSLVIPQHVTNFVGLSSLATMTSTTMTIAAEQDIPPVNPGEPVSPVSPTVR